MKLSIAWIFDHIDADWRTIDIADLVSRFNKTTAEIERVHTVNLTVHNFQLVEISACEKQTMLVRLLHGTSDAPVALPARTCLDVGQRALIKKSDTGYVWATYHDLGGGRDAYLPAIACDDPSAWQQSIELSDVILEVDNKSITNRPDLWGHRGFAREIAAIMQLPLRPLNGLLQDVDIRHYADRSAVTQQTPWTVAIDQAAGINGLGISHLSSVAYQASHMYIMSRLARIDLRAINMLVDLTNYVMSDIGHPMHAFDADAFATRSVIAQAAGHDQPITTLDGHERMLCATDMVIADGATPVSIAGVMGGHATAISPATKAVLIEAGNFNATQIRHTAERLKLRTEASARFEKSLDSYNIPIALSRFIRLAIEYGVYQGDTKPEIVTVGQYAEPLVISLSHQCIESKLGVLLSQNQVVELLRAIEFSVVCDNGIYTVTVPTWRATKDISIPEDIVEEIGRLYGYESIPPQLPLMRLEPKNMANLGRLRAIKQYLAFGQGMHELYSYAFYDESFLQEIEYVPEKTLVVKDPVSENWRQLVTSLVPALIKTAATSCADRTEVRLFEWGRVWNNDGAVREHKRLAGLIFDMQCSTDFYRGKQLIEQLLRIGGLTVEWKQVASPLHPWCEPYETAHLVSNGVVVGYAGMMSAAYAARVGQGAGWVFELDGDSILSTTGPIVKYRPMSKFPESVRDVSVLIGRDNTIDQLIAKIQVLDDRIASVALVDFFERDEWLDQRSVSLRYVVRDEKKTLTKDEVDLVSDKVVHLLHQLGGTIR